MKKSIIWTIGGVMAFTFLALLFIQLEYFDSMVKMKREQFDESVYRALYQASRNQELNETMNFLEADVKRTKGISVVKQSALPDTNNTAPHARTFSIHGGNETDYSSFSLKTIGSNTNTNGLRIANNNSNRNDKNKSMQEIIRKRYIYEKALLDEVIYSVLYTASNKPLKERLNVKLLDQDIKVELSNNGIKIPYHFVVYTADGREIYRCPDFEEEGSDEAFVQELFRNDLQSKMGIIKVHFPNLNKYLFSSIRFLLPSVVFTLVMLVTFIFTIMVIFRQKRVSEMRNDFINNMTHELKTPISSISLAAQMLTDKDVSKNETVMAHVSKVILDESKRLRMLVDKVLQMSMFEKAKSVLKKKELDVNELIQGVVETFNLKVDYAGGEIHTNLVAKYPRIYADEMHFTNVIFNLLDNAVKYKNNDKSLELLIRTWNDDKSLYISIKDNGMGIKKDNLKKIFEKFYRVHTGNVHNVKGFGLGLAYVKKIVTEHGGTIHAESEIGKGTEFIITLPVDKTE